MRKGIKADDNENRGFKFISRYTEETFDDRYTDFFKKPPKKIWRFNFLLLSLQNKLY